MSQYYNFTQKDKEEIIQLRNKGHTVQYIADYKECKSTMPIYNVLKKNGISTRSVRYIAPEKEREAIRLYQQGLSSREVGKRINKNQKSVLEVMWRYGVETREEGYYRWERKYTLDQTFFNTIDTEAKAYFLGLLYSDGNVGWYPESFQYNIRISLQIGDKHILEEMASAVGSDRPLKTRKRNGKNSQLQKSFEFSSQQMCQDLLKLGCPPNKSLIITFPTEKQVPRHLMHHFIRGVFDGDGWIYDQWGRPYLKNIGICSGSPVFIRQLAQYMFYTFNIEGHITESEDKVWKWDTSNTKEVRSFYNLLYRDATYYLNRKYKEFQDFLRLREIADKKAEEQKRYKTIDGINYKKCWICQELKTFDNFTKNKYKKFGLAEECRICKNKRDNERYYRKKRNNDLKPKTSRIKIFEDGVSYRWCSRCKDYLTLDNFCKNKNGHDGLSPRCKNCKRIEEKQRKRLKNKKPTSK